MYILEYGVYHLPQPSRSATVGDDNPQTGPEAALREFGLSDVADRAVGDAKAGARRRGLSGGERKRVAIASEVPFPLWGRFVRSALPGRWAEEGPSRAADGHTCGGGSHG